VIEENVMRIATKLAALSALALFALACGDNYTTQEAYDACTELMNGGPSGEGDELFAACVACHEDCGAGCEMTGGSPAEFVCPAE
jgi:hypothetical protein